MRRNIVHSGADALIYEIRQIVALAKQIEAMGVTITWENIGDPIQKGESVPTWMKDIVSGLVSQNKSWAYTATQGDETTRKFLASKVNERGGAQITSEDILFFNGLGDAVAKIFGFMRREARILGPSPAYSTLSSAEAAHSGYEHLTYELNPDNDWMPDLEDIENKVKYNDSIAGILLINPDNPTGAVYPKEVMREIVKICEKYDIILICDETYAHVNYSEWGSIHLSEVIGDKVCGFALRSISKEFPWPGARCGWLEVFNRKNDPTFERYIKSLLDAKMLEVCSTTLPQLSIPLVYSHPEFLNHLKFRNQKFKNRAEKATNILTGIPGVKVIQPKGAFYLTVLFEDGALKPHMTLPIDNTKVRDFVSPLMEKAALDRRFVLHLLASAGICVVPLSSFCCNRNGFRVTLLEEDETKFEWIYKTLAENIRKYLAS
ncbi:pyridoxal phosphate-dependent aminotransferase [Leptospira bandrabouensis]|uniref:pyridoxal phosphate-dependent aminotransferase n=1 Tax=Leptospira bandrabouensis TaxID=2484903 RepID=UPI001EE8CC76|nr:pyridoxal phosphate-dependent aminotransferase [Leptospira bandrabouensis]MCG6143121.1 pyridoxal phosphate-dependent aminotransferase [Leptospira bandrabouensis]MCG6158780.1 pyridoxal phosphate-dependent aminotransferase [Leptospira bandrabouensis]MCG6162716.1 pyridoxal phosphate-dependent aminotransferase [Leptospira bandrabouensis]MCW7459789.1 pyridoxal phosphate-dependent aminotransferase [Leptospira bandrabouensis]MCW7477098.1 pyridoxal phosphate-dependent aminotransferase [Leptospira b